MIHEDKKYNGLTAELDAFIPEDEPVFLIRGTDPSAQYILNEWIDTNWSMLSEEKRASVSAHARKMADYYQKIKKVKTKPLKKKEKGMGRVIFRDGNTVITKNDSGNMIQTESVEANILFEILNVLKDIEGNQPI